MKELVFLKLGGSLITNKDVAHSARQKIISRIAGEIALGVHENPDLKLLIGHGSGSFGHFAARQYGTRDGVHTPGDWRGFANVWYEAKSLNTIVTESLVEAGLPVIAISPCSQIITKSQQITQWDISQIQMALDNHLIPIVHGDVVFDTETGGTILSTEELFEYLAAQLKPSRILLAGIEPGIWKDFPARSEIFASITPENFHSIEQHLMDSESPDVTGGMDSKVRSMVKLVQTEYSQKISIFSGLEDGSVLNSILGIDTGTSISLE